MAYNTNSIPRDVRDKRCWLLIRPLIRNGDVGHRFIADLSPAVVMEKWFVAGANAGPVARHSSATPTCRRVSPIATLV
jgi:hypothetical protein